VVYYIAHKLHIDEYETYIYKLHIGEYETYI